MPGRTAREDVTRIECFCGIVKKFVAERSYPADYGAAVFLGYWEKLYST
jgi:hypothetical protein